MIEATPQMRLTLNLQSESGAFYLVCKSLFCRQVKCLVVLYVQFVRITKYHVMYR